jgi:hypothetical protein
VARRERRLTKRERQAARAQGPNFVERVRTFAATHGVPEERIRFGGFAGSPKMSDVLAEWAAPMLERLRGDIGAFTNGVKFAAIIWNAATGMLDPAEVVAEWVVKAAGRVGVALSADSHDLVVELVSSRREKYGRETRVILTTDVVAAGHEYRIRVASAAPGDAGSA